MFKNRSLKLTFVKDQPVDSLSQNDISNTIEHIDVLVREFTIDTAKLAVVGAGALMTLHTALKITEHHATK